MHVHIQKLTVHNIPGMTVCWCPVVDGQALEHNGEPITSIEVAKQAAAEHLNVEPSEIKFTIDK
jgi:hypothetical protein